MDLSTERLKIVPLSLEQFRCLLQDVRQLKSALNLCMPPSPLDADTQEAMTWLYAEAARHESAHLWYTNWQIILRSENRAIGCACFKGPPDRAGMVEIGYGIDETYRNSGYMTEAARVMIDWALAQPGVSAVAAETDDGNDASRRVLEKAGMIPVKQPDGRVVWRIKRLKQKK